MTWEDVLYLSGSIGKVKMRRIRWMIEHRLGVVGSVYVIAFASNPENLLDVIPAWNLMQKAYPRKDMHVIGMAGCYDDAINLVRHIVDEVYQVTGDVDIRKYLADRRG